MEASSKLVDTAYDVAIQAALEASRVVLPLWPNPSNRSFDQQRTLELIHKEGVGNYATVADLRAEQTIIKVIHSHPELASHGILAEESGEIQGDGEWRWAVDPIDGTTNFRSGNPDFGICIALFNGNRPVLGIIAMPALQQFVAVKEGGRAALFSYNGDEIGDLAQLAQNFQDPLNNALIGYNLGYTNRAQQLSEIATKLASKVGYPGSLASFSTGNFRLLQGMLGVYFGMAPTVMDIAPAAILIPAIGGVVTDIKGDPIDWNAPNLTYLGSINPQIHGEFLAAMSN